MRRIAFQLLLLLMTSVGITSCGEARLQSNDRSIKERVIVRRSRHLINRLTKEDVEFVIKRRIDLKGKSIRFPAGCSLSFSGGSVVNGNIQFDSTIINGHPCFKQCTYKGRIVINEINDRDFTSKDDTGTLKFLLCNTIENGIRGSFFRDYHISMEGISKKGLVFIEGINSGAEIQFYGGKIYNTYTFPKQYVRPVIVLKNANDITIRNCAFSDVEAHNTHNYDETQGCTFIQCYGDCDGINLLNCSQENGDCFLRSGVYSHDSSNPDNTPIKGLTNSKINIKSKNVGYGLALYCSDGLDIDIEVDSPHRGFYCTGVSNSNIQYKGYNPVETKCHILIKDAVYRRLDKNGEYVLDMKGCQNLVIKAYIEELLPKERVIVFQSYGLGSKNNKDFSFRSGICHHHNIDFSAEIMKVPNEDSYYMCLVRSDSGEHEGNNPYGCKVSDICIHNIQSIGGSASSILCRLDPYTESEIVFKDCSFKSDGKEGYDIDVLGNSIGNISLVNCNVRSINVRDKTIGNVIVTTNSTVVSRGLVSKGHSIKELVKIDEEK